MGFDDYFDDKPTPVATSPTPRPVASSNGHATSYGQAALHAELDRLAAATEGTRNDTLNRVVFNIAQLADAGHINFDDAWDQLAATARSTGLTPAEISATMRSARRGAATKPRANTPDPAAPAPLSAPTVLRLDDTTGIADFWTARDAHTHILNHAHARRVSPWALLAITLARVVTHIPPFVQLPPLVGGHASLNLFVGVVGRSGAGKGGAEAAATDVIDYPEPVETFTIGSGEAIAHAYMERRYDKETKEQVIHQHNETALVSVAEIDTLAALHSRQASTVLPELRKAWMGERLGFHYVEKAKRLPVPAHHYRLCLIAGIQPERASVLLEDADGGTPQRFIWAPALDADAPDMAPAAPEPWPWKRPTWPLAIAGRVVLDVCATARDTIDQARLERLRGHHDALDGHALLARLKVAAALALLDQHAEVTDDDWTLAGTVMTVSDHVRSRVVATLEEAKRGRNRARGEAEAERAVMVAETVEEAAIKRVAQVLLRRLQKGDWIIGSDLRKAVAGRDRIYVDRALERLVEAGVAECEQVEHKGQTGSRYRLVGESK